jgi:Acetyltransferases
MSKITFEVLQESNIEPCRVLCDELMRFQQSKATIFPSAFDNMSFDTRMKPAYDDALEKQVILAKDGDTAIGYVFSTIDVITEEMRDFYPEQMPRKAEDIGFYPAWLELPQKVGRLSNLYVREQYKGQGIGSTLCDMAMEWLRSFSDAPVTFTYISNGNDVAYDFYLHKGFKPSHDVFGGFIRAVCCGHDVVVE